MPVCKHGVGTDDFCPACNTREPKKLADLKAEAEKLQQATIEKCIEALGEVMKKHGCKLASVPRIEDGKIMADVVVVAE